MAKKDKKSILTGGDILIAVLISLASAIGFFLVVLVAGSILFPESWESQTAEAPSAQVTTRGTLPSKAPVQTAEPMQDVPEETEDPVEAPGEEPAQEPPTATTQAPDAQLQTYAQTQPPAEPTTQSSAPAAQPTIGPVVPAVAPMQSTATTQINGKTVYVTPSGDHWHYDNNCNGGNYYVPQPGEIERRGLTPCSRCVS